MGKGCGHPLSVIGHEKRALRAKEFVTGMYVDRYHVSSQNLFFIIREQFPSTSLDRKSSNLLPQSRNLPFIVLHENRVNGSRLFGSTGDENVGLPTKVSVEE